MDFEASTATAEVSNLSVFALTILELDSRTTPASNLVQSLLPTATLAPVGKPALSPTAVSASAVAGPTVAPKTLPLVAAELSHAPSPMPAPTAVPVQLPTPTPVPSAPASRAWADPVRLKW